MNIRYLFGICFFVTMHILADSTFPELLKKTIDKTVQSWKQGAAQSKVQVAHISCKSVKREQLEFIVGKTYDLRKVENTTDHTIKIEQGSDGRPIVYQPYPLDEKVILEYVLLPQAYTKGQFKFPQDFMVEIPKVWLKQDGRKRLSDIAVLGTHNCFANPVDGFLYYQQQMSMRDQVELGGVRMLRPAWHNPSGSILEKPNMEPILCHSDDHKCGSVSLLTRGMRPHKKVKEFNLLLMEMLYKYPEQVVFVGLNNFLDASTTDDEILKVPGLANMALTVGDLQNEKNQKIWGGFWPTLDWMLRNNKRVVFFNDKGSTRYTIDYKRYVKMNGYGTRKISEASQPRDVHAQAMKEPACSTLVELSWFQTISLPLHEQILVQDGVSLYTKFLALVPSMLARAFYSPKEMFTVSMSFQKNVPHPLQSFIGFLKMVEYKVRYLLSLGLAKSLLEKVKNSSSKLGKIITSIEEYAPVKQDNSLATLQQLIRLCRKSGVIDTMQIPNIIMLDFATTNGDGLVMVNLINMLQDQKLKIQFTSVGGFCYRGKFVITQGIL